MNISIKNLSRRATALTAMTAAGVLALGGVAFADTVQNDVVAGGNDTIVAGGSTTVNYRIGANNGDGENGCNASSTSPANVTIGVPVGVTATPNTLTFTGCGTNLPVVFSSSSPGSYDLTASVADSGVGTYNVNPAKFTLTVNAAAPTNTPPVVSVSGVTDGASYEINNVPPATCDVSDAEDTGESATPVVDDSALVNGLGQVTVTCSYTDEGNESDSDSVGYTIVDTGDPSISYTLTPAASNANGWFNQTVGVDFTCTDPGRFGGDGSGIASCEGDTTLGEGANQSATGTATDNAGNTSQATASGISIDVTPPTVGLIGGPADGGSYYDGYVPAAPTCEGDDALSGIDTCTVTGYSAAPGERTVTATATDRAGNQSSTSVSYTVQAWSFSGFYRPVDMGGVWNTAKGGSTIPLKFELFATDGTELTDPSFVKLVVSKVACDSGDVLTDDIEALSAGSTSLRYDTTTGQFIQNWKTPTGAGCYIATMKPTSPTATTTPIAARFSLRK